jgi:hypothetical protein
VFDQHFRDVVVCAAKQNAGDLLSSTPEDLRAGDHRELMRDIKVLLSVVAAGESGDERSRILGAARTRIDALRSLQSDSGLFTGGDNLQSPPDSAFTINDACDTYAFLEAVAEAADVADMREKIAAIIHAGTEPLLRGGVHTPNHRWEISAALARIHRSFPNPSLTERASEWLAEGIDVDADGLYSERSPNYAAHVSNPSLTALASILDRPELESIVLRNMEATLTLLRPDDTVETVQSRRQDQNAPFPLAPYLAAFRAAAVATGRGDFADAARRAAADGVLDPELLGEALLRPDLLEELPDASMRPTEASLFLGGVSLAARRTDLAESVLYGGSDYGGHGRIRSGLANNPTFCRLFAGDAVLDSVRLSREFFDVGPFRASAMHRTGDDTYVLEETVEAAYYQPVASVDRRADGRYDLVDDGRFSASMSFPLRPRNAVRMTTSIVAALLPDGVDLRVHIDAPTLRWALEFGFREGGKVESGMLDADGTWTLPTGRGSYRVGGSRILIWMTDAEPDPSPMQYQPGQDYGFLGSTDAVSGERVRIGGEAPSTFSVHIRADRGEPR